MTSFQYLLYVLGFWRFKRYRRWVGGRWAERYVEPPPHSSDCPHWRWELDARASFLADDNTEAIEQWPMKLPTARVRQLK